MHWLNAPSFLRESNPPPADAADNNLLTRALHTLLMCLLFIGVFVAITAVESVLPSLLMVPELMLDMVRENVDLTNQAAIFKFSTQYKMSNDLITVQLYSTALGTLLAVVARLELERRPLRSLGFVKKNAVRDYFIGLAAGFLLFSGAVGIALAAGGLQFDGVSAINTTLFVMLFGWLIQGMSEEVIFRGFLCNSLTQHCSRPVAAAISALAFMAAHLANPGVSPLACVNLFLFGLFAAFYMFRFDSLWGVCALHAVWNFAQGNLYGIPVSGMDISATVLRLSQRAGGKVWNGGAFGMEGGLGVSIVLLIGLALVLFLPKKGESGAPQDVKPASSP